MDRILLKLRGWGMDDRGEYLDLASERRFAARLLPLEEVNEPIVPIARPESANACEENTMVEAPCPEKPTETSNLGLKAVRMRTDLITTTYSTLCCSDSHGVI